LDKLRELCEKDAGIKIYKTVETDGYYDATRKVGALRLLIPSDFSFTEYCNFDPNIASLFNELGCWRLTKIPRKTGQCDVRVDESLWKSGIDAIIEFRENNCIAVEKIEKPEARYIYEVEREEWWVNEQDGIKMRRYTGKIINTKTEEINGEAISYSLFPGWLYSETRSKFKSAIGCGSYHVTGMDKTIPFAAGLIEKTLIPRKVKY
jgi:hypothetical protein